MERLNVSRLLGLAAVAIMPNVQTALPMPRLNPHATTWRANGKAVSGAAANKRAAKKRKNIRARSKK